MTVANIKYTTGENKPKVICDTNVWYNIESNNFKPNNEVSLVPTCFTLVELASSTNMTSIKFFQDVIKIIKKYCGPIIPHNPFDFVLFNHDSNYPAQDVIIKQVLENFSKILLREIPDEAELDEGVKNKIIKDCTESRKANTEFADYSTESLIEIRKNINKGVGKKKHISVDPTEINKEMMKIFLNEHVKDTGYTIDFESFDWSKIELFMVVTEVFFKKLETTKNMKMHPNDVVDWFNMLYVTPEDQYLTFENSWRNYILSDDRIKHYLYK